MGPAGLPLKSICELKLRKTNEYSISNKKIYKTFFIFYLKTEECIFKLKYGGIKFISLFDRG